MLPSGDCRFCAGVAIVSSEAELAFTFDDYWFVCAVWGFFYAGFVFAVSPVLVVFFAGYGAEVGGAIIGAVAIDMVDNCAIGDASMRHYVCHAVSEV